MTARISYFLFYRRLFTLHSPVMLVFHLPKARISLIVVLSLLLMGNIRKAEVGRTSEVHLVQYSYSSRGPRPCHRFTEVIQCGNHKPAVNSSSDTVCVTPYNLFTSFTPSFFMGCVASGRALPPGPEGTSRP